MHLDDDDLYDYEQDSFDEDAAIADVVGALKPVVVSAADAEAELDRVDWDVDAAIANLRKRSKPKNSPKPKPEPAANATVFAAKQEQTQNAQDSKDTQGDPSAQVGAAAALAESAGKKKLSLSELAAERRKASQAAPSSGRLSSALEKLKNRKVAKDPGAAETGSDASSRQASPDVSNTTPVSVHKKWEPQIAYAVVNHAETLKLREPSEFGAVIGIGVRQSSKTNPNIAKLAATASTRQGFSQPSPDDAVLNAQASAFDKKQSPAPANKTAPAMGKTPAKNTTPAAAPTQKSAAPEKKTAVEAKQKDALLSKLAGLNMKPACSFVVIGHVDAGKSTLMGRLLLDTGALSAKTMQKYEHESTKAGKASFWLAWAMDATDEERERGVTVDIGEAKFETAATRFTVLDAPGHRDYVPNMIAGVAQADIAVLVVDSDTNAFESGFSLDGQTKEHAVLARSLGLDRVIVAVNKLDTQAWSEARFDEISAQLTEFLVRKVGYTEKNIVYVPTSGITGANVVQKTDDAKWYTGPSLVGALDEFAHSRASLTATKQPFRFLAANAFVEAFQSTVTVSGRVLSGAVEAGDPVQLVATDQLSKIKAIVDRDFLVAGESGEMKLDTDQDVTVKPGDVIAVPGAGLYPATRFTAKVRLFDVPRPILPGTKLAFHLGRVDDTVKVSRIVESLDAKKAGGRKIRHLGKGAAARVELELERPAVLAPPEVCKDLGRFVLRLNGLTIGGGIVESVDRAS